MPGFANPHVRIALAVRASNVDSLLQFGASTHGVGSRCFGSATRQFPPPTASIASSSQRVVRRPRQIYPWWTASRISLCAYLCVIELLRTASTHRQLSADDDVRTAAMLDLHGSRDSRTPVHGELQFCRRHRLRHRLAKGSNLCGEFRILVIG